MHSYEIATPTHQRVLERVKQERQLNLQGGDSTYQPLRIISGYNPRLFVADPDFGQPDPGDGAHPNLPSRAVGERE